MRDIPIFTTDYGVASLILREIPYKQIAYIKIQDVQPGQISQLCEECRQFCRAAGADIVVVSGHPDLNRYPEYGQVLSMRLSGFSQELTEASMFPVTEQTVTRWRSIYNEKMGPVDFAATMTFQDEKKILESGGAYFIHREGTLLGIGWMEGSELLAVASCVPGMGELVLRSMLTVADSDSVELEVAASNERAIRLYERLGFLTVSVKNQSYRLM